MENTAIQNLSTLIVKSKKKNKKKRSIFYGLIMLKIAKQTKKNLKNFI